MAPRARQHSEIPAQTTHPRVSRPKPAAGRTVPVRAPVDPAARPEGTRRTIGRPRHARRPLAILVLSGPNLQLLGTREPEIYGKDTLTDIHARLGVLAGERGATVDCRQSNHEGELLDWLGSAPSQGFAGVLLNGGAFTHTSLALYDAIRAIGLPVIEVHLSNPEAREAYRKESKLAPACVGKVVGFGANSYLLALRGLLDRLDAKR
jgi:3-dehydroquinate dehydratase-2